MIPQPVRVGDVSQAEDNGFDPTCCDFAWMLEEFGGRISNRGLSSGLQMGWRAIRCSISFDRLTNRTSTSLYRREYS